MNKAFKRNKVFSVKGFNFKLKFPAAPVRGALNFSKSLRKFSDAQEDFCRAANSLANAIENDISLLSLRKDNL